MGALSNKEIRQAFKEDLIVIRPFNDANVGTNSYDVTLGEWYYREQHPLMKSPIYNIYAERLDRIWGPPLQSQSYSKTVSIGQLPKGMENIAENDQIILLAPGETILAHTIEFIGGRTSGYHGIKTKMHARSSIGRSMIGVCKCAGLGDAGYINRWTMEITSFSQYHWIPLVVGRRIAQIEFEHLDSIDEKYTQLSQKYQTGDDIEEIVKAWKPTAMLPRLHLDREVSDGDDRSSSKAG